MATVVTDDGVEIAYADRGTRNPGFVLVHGWCCDRRSMAPLARRLAGRGRVINVDLRGHGSSSRPRHGLDVDGLVTDVRAVARAGALEHPVLVGHSMGGRVVLATVQRDPTFASAVVLLDAAVVEDPAYVAQRRRQLDEPAWRDSFRARIDRLWLDSDTSTRRRRFSEIMVQTPHEIAVSSLEAADAIDAPAALAGFSGPALYIAASAPREQSTTLKTLKADLTYAQVVGSGHFVQLDALDQVMPMIATFCELAGLTTPPSLTLPR